MNRVVCLFAILLAFQASAMDCRRLSPEKISSMAEVAFVGTVVSIEDSSYNPGQICRARSEKSPRCGGKLVTFNVSESLRGDVSSRATVISEDVCYCLGSDWKVGAAYLIVGRPNNLRIPGQVIAANGCGGTGAVDERLVKALRDPKP